MNVKTVHVQWTLLLYAENFLASGDACVHNHIAHKLSTS